MAKGHYRPAFSTQPERRPNRDVHEVPASAGVSVDSDIEDQDTVRVSMPRWLVLSSVALLGVAIFLGGALTGRYYASETHVLRKCLKSMACLPDSGEPHLPMTESFGPIPIKCFLKPTPVICCPIVSRPLRIGDHSLGRMMRRPQQRGADRTAMEALSPTKAHIQELVRWCPFTGLPTCFVQSARTS